MDVYFVKYKLNSEVHYLVLVKHLYGQKMTMLYLSEPV